MPTLSSLLVQREIATMRAVENAISRQVLNGGDFPTNLLEIGAVSEPVLSRLLAESLGLEPAPVGRLRAPESAVRSLVPGELALLHGIFPLAIDGRTLVLATSEAISPAVAQALAFVLEMDLRAVAAPLVRIREALSVHYDIPLDRRFARLLGKLDGTGEPSFGTPAPRAVRLSRAPAPAEVIGPVAKGVPTVPGLSPAAGDEAIEASRAGIVPLQPRLPSVDLVRVADALAAARTASVVPASLPRSRAKVPFSGAMAERELEQTASVEGVLTVFFSFALQFFEYVALFGVHADVAEGRDASGPGADRAKVLGLAVPLVEPSSFATARNRRGPLVAPLSSEGLDAELA